jgi:hypothetical protein
LIRFKGTLFEQRGVWGSKVESQFDEPWTEESVWKVFGHVQPQAKEHQRLWSATRYKDDGNRGRTDLLAVHAAQLDFDCCNLGDMDRVVDHLEAQGLAYLLYTSWSNGRPDKVHDDTQIIGPFDCFRIVLPYDREVTADEHTAIVDALFGFEIPDLSDEYRKEAQNRVVTFGNGRERMAKPRGWDPTSNQPHRGYYQPLPEAVLEVREGAPLPADAILSRPTTARPLTRKARPYSLPTPEAEGAIGILERALDKQELGLTKAGAAGWRRSTCPYCLDASPSLTVRANGDGVDLKCHAGCTRAQILEALDLQGAVWDPPSSLKIDLECQLEAQRPPTEAISVDAAGENLYRDLLEAVRSNKRVVLQSPAGTGKSYQSARAMAELVHEGQRICYATQEHAVAHETRNKLPEDIRRRSVHIHSPLIQVGDGPVCQRADELKDKVFEFGVSLQGSLCPRCPFRDTCEALQAAKERTEQVKTASVIFVSHAGIRQVYGMDSEGRRKGLGIKLICDEMPTVFERVAVSHLGLTLLRSALLPSCAPVVGRVVQELARAVLEQEEPGDVSLGPCGETLNAGQLAAEWGRVSMRDGSAPSATEKALLQTADALVRLVAYAGKGGLLEGLDEPEKDGIYAMLPDACHQALVDNKGVLLSATPTMVALDGFELRAQEVVDGAPVRRVMVLRGARGSKALTGTYYDDTVGAFVRRERGPEDAPGVPWPALDQAMARALREADRLAPDAKVLFVTFKEIADLLRKDERRLASGRFRIAHYGALRGKNDWEQGKPDECQVCYCFGAPRFAIFDMFAHYGLYGQAASDAWIAQAAGELAQAEGRLRIPRRTKPCTVVVEGDVAPAGWHTDNVSQVISDLDPYETPSSLLEAALVWAPLAEVAEEANIGKADTDIWFPVGAVEVLRKWASPSTPEAMRRLARLSGRRRLRFEQDFSWRP